MAVSGDTITSLALIIHELATNAAKYGALSEPEGRVTVRWTLKAGRLALRWEERGGPPIEAPPLLEGFGTLLAQKSASGNLGGSIAFDWEPEGLTVRLSAAQGRLSA